MTIKGSLRNEWTGKGNVLGTFSSGKGSKVGNVPYEYFFKLVFFTLKVLIARS